MRWMAAACTMLAFWVSAEDTAPRTDADRSAHAPNLVIAPNPQANETLTPSEKPFTWSQLPGGIPGNADPDRKPGEPLVIGGNRSSQNPSPFASPSPQPESQDQDDKDTPPYRWHYPVLHLPIELPSISISGVSSMMGRMQVAQDARIETRYITVPLPGASPYLTPYAPQPPSTAAPKLSPQHKQMIERQKESK